jgi:hypothetical protein
MQKWHGIALMMDAVNISETSVSFYQTTGRNILEDSHFHTLHRKILKAHKAYCTPYLRIISWLFFSSFSK